MDTSTGSQEGQGKQEFDVTDSVQAVVLKMCARCKGMFDRLYTFWHLMGGVEVCSDCWDKMEAKVLDGD